MAFSPWAMLCSPPPDWNVLFWLTLSISYSSSAVLNDSVAFLLSFRAEGEIPAFSEIPLFGRNDSDDHVVILLL
jgi:hypothetical protein